MSGLDEQVRAQRAYDQVAKRATDQEAWRAYRTMAMKLPVMVHNEGMVRALHFVAARARPAQRVILDDLVVSLQMSDVKGRAQLLHWLRALRGDELRDRTREVQRHLGWYKRLAQAFGKEGNDPGRST